MDNYATHKTSKIKTWLARRPHYYVHFTPTSASWINQVERWFAELTRKRLKRGVHTSVGKLEADIRGLKRLMAPMVQKTMNDEVRQLVQLKHVIEAR